MRDEIIDAGCGDGPKVQEDRQRHETENHRVGQRSPQAMAHFLPSKPMTFCRQHLSMLVRAILG